MKGKIVAPYFELLARRMIKEAPYVVYVTNEYLQRLYPTKGKTIGISNVEILESDQEVLKKRIEKINRKEGPLVLCTVAAIDVPYKGQEYVIRAMNQLRIEGIETKYFVIGGGDKSRLSKIAEKYDLKESVIFTGPIMRENVFEYLDLSDVYIQPSLQEGLPRAMIEAMSRALPAIGFNTAGIPELIDKKYVCKRKSVGQITQCIELLLKSNNLENEAKKNFIKSKEYLFSTLNENRKNFFTEAIENMK